MKQLKSTFTKSLAALVTTALAILSPRFAGAAEKPLQKINVAYSSISGNMAPLWVTQDKGFFAVWP
jgi:ABC-type nitrate/sulfonate/bicarbonate transport system substrate-binding protein